jgi:hypothetical protein
MKLGGGGVGFIGENLGRAKRLRYLIKLKELQVVSGALRKGDKALRISFLLH